MVYLQYIPHKFLQTLVSLNLLLFLMLLMLCGKAWQADDFDQVGILQPTCVYFLISNYRIGEQQIFKGGLSMMFSQKSNHWGFLKPPSNFTILCVCRSLIWRLVGLQRSKWREQKRLRWFQISSMMKLGMMRTS